MVEEGWRCPACGQSRAWCLGDGRCKCRGCGRRYTPSRRRRLDAGLRRRLALCFWQMVPTRQAATVVHLNRKTVQSYYRALRRGIGGREGWSEPEGSGGEGELPKAIKGLVLEGGRIRVVPPQKAAEAPQCAMIYLRTNGPAHPRALSDLQLWVSQGSGTAAETFVRFWTFAGRLSTRSRGQHLQDVPLFFSEVAYRVNQRENPRVIDNLCRLIDGSAP
ncbi:hypothetical protein DSOUD_1080 [Desulfuromonas soudanensis]|uniref:Transposase n=1 Tax=Desulfuromonas soudanensis TaxID=1603606 RepID=A0A0M4D1B8_9BACT|nr:hypothetical protein [Desulfuromonas soudanensis]ALC15864.1 hypothetical protein DSOUD_1080 [Desulfuromonas soudanensis]